MPYKIHFLLAILMVMTFQVQATPVGFKDNKAGFDAAVAGLSGVSVRTLDFESQVAGTIVSEGSTIEGLTFNTNLPSPFEMAIRGDGSVSDPNSLAQSGNGGGTFGSFGLGDRVDVSFSESNAFGFFLVLPNENGQFDFFDNDVNVTFGGTTISIEDDDVVTQTSGSFDFFWIGLVDDMAMHTTASIQFGNPGSSFIGVGEFDDFTTTQVVSISEPIMILLFGTGLLGLIGFARRGY